VLLQRAATKTELQNCERFVRRVAEGVYPGKGYRVTLFGPDANGVGITPALRYDADQRAVKAITREIVFERGWPVAGFAWQHLGSPALLVMPDHPNRRFFAEALGLPERVSELLAMSESLPIVKQILCVGIPAPPPLALVLSVDTFESDGLGSRASGSFELKNWDAVRATVKEFANVINGGEWSSEDKLEPSATASR
jgi:hypothetical protein